MSASVFDSPLMAGLFPTGEVGRLFSDSAQIRAMLLVEGALATAQGGLGVIPEISAAAITRATREVQIDPGALARATGQNGVPVPALVAAFRAEMNAPEHAQYVHWGATSQDILDTALMLRLRQALSLIEGDVRGALEPLARLAETHADLPMAARTYGQHATPTSFGAVAAEWGRPLLSLLGELPALRAATLLVSLSGAAGTAAALGPEARDTRRAMAEALGLGDPQASWHTDRTPVLRIADWLTRLMLACGKIGDDLTAHSRSDLAELRLSTAGGSSTMPQKQNPVVPAALCALARQAPGQLSTLQSAAQHSHQRDGAAWFTEWMVLPQIVLSAACAVQQTRAVLATLTPDASRMAATLQASGGALLAETLSFALARHLPRPEAQQAVKALCREAQETGEPLTTLVTRDWPQLDAATLLDPAQQLGHAPQDARDFAAAVRAALN